MQFSLLQINQQQKRRSVKKIISSFMYYQHKKNRQQDLCKRNSIVYTHRTEDI